MILRLLVAAFACSTFLAARGQSPSDYVLQGRIYFEQRNITRANDNFAAALALDPNHTTANAFYAVTRLLAVTKTPSFNSLLDSIGLTQTNRDAFSWSAAFRTNSAGTPLVDDNLNAEEAVTFIRGTLLPEVVGAIGNLSRIQDQSFLLNLTADEAFSTHPVTVDFGDIRLMRASLEFSRLVLLTISTWNFDAQASAVRSLYENDELSAEQILRKFPQLLTISSTNDLPLAKEAFQRSISDYLLASFLIRSRPTNIVRLFNLDATEAEAERTFRITLGDLERSLDSVVRLTEFPDVSAHAGVLFSGPKAVREFLPEFAGNDVIAGTLPEITFGEAVFGIEAYQIEAELSGLGVDVVPRLIPERPQGGTIHISANVVNGQRVYLLRSTDLRTWIAQGFILPTNGVATFAVQVPVADNQVYFTASDRLPPPPTIYAPLDEASLIAQNKVYVAATAGQPEIRLSFPAPGQYQILQGGIKEMGTISGLVRNVNKWTFTKTPSAGQAGAQEGILQLNFTAIDTGTWTFIPTGGQAEFGTFSVTLATNDGGNVTTLTGRTLQVTYANGGEKFQFTTDKNVSYENGVQIGSYVWNSIARRVDITLLNGWIYEIIIPAGGNTGTVAFRQFAGGSSETMGMTYTLSNPQSDTVTSLAGRTLQINYPNGGGEKFQFNSDSALSYEDGALTGTYTWDQGNRRVNVTLSNGWLYEITIPLGSNAATVLFRQNANGSGTTDAASYTLTNPL